jgi:uncharacterized repeat protein (TIGR01451 family)
LPGEFLEEGVDLTALGLSGCFSTFMAETRSSTSPTATLSDFVIGSFPLCNLASPGFTGLSKFDTRTGQGDVVTYQLTVQNTGAMPLYIQSVTDTLLGTIVSNHTLQAPTAPVTSITASNNAYFGASAIPLAVGDTVTIQVSRPVQSTDPDPTNSTTTFIGTDDLAGTEDQIKTTSSNSINLFQPSASLSETVSPTTATQAGQVITYTFTVTNTSSSDSPNLVLDLNNPNDSFTDSLLTTAAGYNLEADAIHAATGDNTATVASIAPGASFTFTETRAIQPGDPTPLTDTSNAAFTLAQDLGTFPNIIPASGSASVTLVPDLNIVKTVTADQTVIHPGDTASFTITVSNPGAGTANNVVLTDPLPDADQLTWTVTSFTGFTSASISGGVLTASEASMFGGGTASVVISAVVPLTFFGTSGGGTGNGNGDAVPLSLFELDGNVTTGALGSSGSTTISHDWDQVYADNTANPVTNTADALASSFVNDKINTTADDIFTGGGSKDPNPISQWQFKTGKPQGKDDIENAFAALYKDPTTSDQVLYAGLTRYDNSGDATAGFWFFVNPISENANGTFSGTHSDGDILLVSDFTVGGSVSTIKVFEWSSVPVNGSNLVLLNNGNLANGSTFAIVNGGAISVPWSYTNKSGAHQPAAGEFLEEGINLTGLGLNGCFSSFLAETRSSQSPTATLSDLVLGSFHTCDVMLPNQASVKADNFNNGQPITSNTVSIDLNDGMAQQAASVGSGAANSLTYAQLQTAVAQAIAAWSAAGADPSALGNVANFAIDIAKLPDGELGWEVPGHIWIDPTAQGWGWSTGSTPTSGQMDLLTVVSHEVGHVLGFGDHASGNDIMTTTLDTGMRRLPEAPGNVAAVAAQGGAAVSAGVSLSASSRTEVGSTSTVPGATAAIQDSGSQRSLSGALSQVGQQASGLVPITPASPAATPTGADRDASTAQVPGRRPPTGLDGGSDLALPQTQAEGNAAGAGLLPAPSPAGGRSDLGGQAEVGLWQQACDVCFADESGWAEPAEPATPLSGLAVGGPGLETAAAATVLTVALDSFRAARRPQTDPRRRLPVVV